MSFQDYIINVKGKKIVTAEKYIRSLEKMKDLIEQKYGAVITCDFLSINKPSEFKALIEKFESNLDLVLLNLKWHHILSAAYNNYLKYLEYCESDIL
ncbi:MAG: hypothetical protein AB1414_16615 [bacterium]